MFAVDDNGVVSNPELHKAVIVVEPLVLHCAESAFDVVGGVFPPRFGFSSLF